MTGEEVCSREWFSQVSYLVAEDPTGLPGQGTQNDLRRHCGVCDGWSPFSALQQAAVSLKLSGEVEKKEEKRHFE